jgi:uncharacterized protein
MAKLSTGSKKFKLLIVALAAVVIVGSFEIGTLFRNGPSFQSNGKSYHVLIARTASEQSKGLGDRASLPTNEAMLFPFPNTAVRCFWMKNMEFSLDMVWLNSDQQIVHIQSDISPNTYPETFCPATPAQYVLELNAGQAKAANLQLGQTLNF